MRVLHVIPSVAARYGGPSAALKGMTAALAARGVSVSVATTNADGPRALEVPLDDEVTEDGVQYRFFARTLPGEYKFSWPLARWLRQHVRDFDVLHVHALFSFATIPACRSASRARVPYVLRPLGTLGSWSLAHRGWKKAPYLALVERRHLRDAAAIHATSEGERDALEALGVGGKTRVIPLGVEVAEAAVLRRREERIASRDMASGSAGLQLLFLSRLHPVKGLPLLFEAVARARANSAWPIRVTVAGDGPASYVAELHRVVDTLGLADRVDFAGRLEGAAKLAAFDRADLFVLPSSHENFGIAAAEALGRGLPVLLSDQVGLAPDVARSGAGRVVTRDAAVIATELLALAAAPEELRGMGRAAAELARRAYSWSACAGALAALYDEVRGTRDADRARRGETSKSR